MTDKEKKNKIADILLDFYEEYHSNEINRPMIPSIYSGKIIDSLQEKPVSEELDDAAKFYADTHIEWFDADGNPNVFPAFKAGAQWQKEHNKL